ncbi:glycosyltransferase family 39 protein [Streptomyces indicus]|uniref:Mannosyltransferase n=1 Tax=Streptomyces indicus TaxID=417292 RepID=A0A1G9E0P3_9ACTN|nr:glycosyltransferase family 39 protein [Streptomyces indicus]SDK69701.1 mannosyltransferase [Streptomyces indicus]
MYRTQASAFTGTPTASAHRAYPATAPVRADAPTGHLDMLARLLLARPAVTAAALPALAAAAIGAWGLDRGSMWRDESAAFAIARRPLPEIWRLTGSADAVDGVYYTLLHFVLRLHPGEVVLRLPSLLAVVLTAALVAVIGTRLARARVGLWAGLLYAVTPATGYYATDGSPYALVCAGAATATLLFLRAAELGRARDWCRYGAVLGCTAYVHPSAALLLGAHAVTLLVSWRRIPGEVWRGWAVAAAAALTALLPLLGLTYGQGVRGVASPGIDRVDALLRTFTGPAPLVVTAALLMICIALNAPLPRTGRISLNSLALPLVLVPPALLIALAQTGPLYHPAYALCALAGVPLLAAAGGERCAAVVRRLLPPGHPPHRAAAALAGAAAVAAAFVWQLPQHKSQAAADGRPDDMAAVARLAAHELQPGDPVLYLPSPARRHALTYPAGFAGTKDLALAAGPAASGTLYGKETGPLELRRKLAELDRVWVLAERRATEASWNPKSPTEAAKLSVINEQFVLRGEFPERSGVLRLYVRRAPERPIDWPAGKPVPVVDPVLEAHERAEARRRGETEAPAVGAAGAPAGEAGSSAGAPSAGNTPAGPDSRGSLNQHTAPAAPDADTVPAPDPGTASVPAPVPAVPAP